MGDTKRYDPGLMQFCQTDRQIEVLQVVLETPSIRAAAKRLGVNRNAVGNVLQTIEKNAAKRNYHPDSDRIHLVPEGHAVGGQADYYQWKDEEGNTRQRWVRSQADLDSLRTSAEEIVAGFKEEIPKEFIPDAPSYTNDDLLNCYIITDYHLGMLAWGEETGDDWDINIAEETIIQWFKIAIAKTSNASTAVLAQIGDFFHYDTLVALTPQSKHVLDADTRYRLMLRTGIRIIRRIIQLLLQKHESVHVIMAEGNHDEVTSLNTSEWLAVLYENTDRVTVDLTPDIYYCYEHGETCLFFHHGHKRRPTNVDSVFVAKYKEQFGRSKHVYAHMGHLHHRVQLDSNLMLVTQYRTLAAPDAYASRGGWMSPRESPAIEYHKKYGWVTEYPISIEQVKAYKT